MAVMVKFPDGNCEKANSDLPELRDDFEVTISEDEFGLRFEVNRLSPVVAKEQSVMPDSVPVLRYDINFNNTSSYVSDSDNESNLSNLIFGATVAPSLFERWKRPGPCNMMFMIFEAWQVGRIFTGVVDKSQQSDDFYTEFDENGTPILESKTQIGFIVDPVVKLVLLDSARRFLNWKVSVCKFGEPPDNSNKTSLQEIPQTQETIEPETSVVKNEMASLARGMLSLYEGGAQNVFYGEEASLVKGVNENIILSPLFVNPQTMLKPYILPEFSIPRVIINPVRTPIPVIR